MVDHGVARPAAAAAADGAVVHVEHAKPSSPFSSYSHGLKRGSNNKREYWSTRDLSQPSSSSNSSHRPHTTTASATTATSSSLKSTSKNSTLSYQERIAAYNESNHNRNNRNTGRSSGSGSGSGSGSDSGEDGRATNAGISRSTDRAADDNDDDDVAVVRLLALQVYHIPGNTWCGDWCMYMRNNHPVFGICCHNKLHPIGSCQRIIALIGTVLFGLALTNMFYLFYLWNPKFDQVVAEFIGEDGTTTWTLTTGMLLLWTVGSSIHCAFNLAIWHIAACACCQSGGCCESCACCPSLGKHVSRVLIVCILACTVMIVLLRVAITNEERIQQEDFESIVGDDDKKVHINIDDGLVLDVESASQFQFVAAYLVEMALSLFVYFPVIGTILFSGVLSCGCKVPLLGGRPYEIAMEEKRRNNNNNNKSTITTTTSSNGSDGRRGMTGSLTSVPPKRSSTINTSVGNRTSGKQTFLVGRSRSRSVSVHQDDVESNNRM
jgi:hypothetical protein